LFCSPKRPDRFWGHATSYSVGPGLKRLGRGVDHSSSSSPEVKKEWIPTSTPRVCLQGLDKVSFFLIANKCQKGLRRHSKRSFICPCTG